jgi:hypothetical protein
VTGRRSSCASRRWRTRQGIGDSLPSCRDVSNAKQLQRGVILHLVVEDLGLARLSGRNKVLVENVEDVLTDLLQLHLDGLPILFDELDLSLVALGFLLLLDRGNNSPGSTTRTDDILVGDRQKISLLDRELLV